MKLKEYQKNLKKEYQETFQENKSQPKKRFEFKVRYAVALAFTFLFVLILGYHISILSYNAGVDRFNDSLRSEVVNYEATTNLSSIHSKKEYENVVSKYQKERVYREKKQSLLSVLFSLQLGGCTSSAGDMGTAPDAPTNDSSYNTNIQVEGIDESDVAKCDGTYIYYLDSSMLYIYSIETQSIVATRKDDGYELYVNQNRIVSIGEHKTILYEFTNDTITLKHQFEYQRYLNSRVVEDNLYLVVGSSANEEDILYDDCYYDSCSQPRWLYSLVRLNLNTFEKKEVQLLSQSGSILYASHQYFYIASRENIFTSISIFSFDLEPVGVVRVCGTILNQFSMDEYEDSFRVVSTDTSKNATELNAISIFSISNEFQRVGFLDQGIGLGRQTVRSVRFDQNTCYVVTYENTDPLYEIDCSNPASPKIISAYQAPGYSNYLHTFTVEDKEYVLGLGFTDQSRYSTKISVYEKTETTTQIGQDFILVRDLYFDKGNYVNPYLNVGMFSNHKALWLFEKDNKLYLGAIVAADAYLIFEIDVNDTEEVVKIYQTLPLKNGEYSRLFLVNDILYLIDDSKVKALEFNQILGE